MKTRSVLQLLFGLLALPSFVFAQTGLIGNYAGIPKPQNIGSVVTTPSGLAVSPTGDVYVASYLTDQVYRLSAQGDFSVFAGTGVPNGFGGDGGSATSALLCNPFGLSVDGIGNLFIADSCNNRVRKVSTSGIITTFAGNGTSGGAGDNGLATAAQLSPTRVFADGAGNVYISGSLRIRKVNTSGIISNFAGTGFSGSGGDGGPATSAQFTSPAGMTMDGNGNFYVADPGNGRIRKIVPNGTISTVAGGGVTNADGILATSAVLNVPYAVAVDGSGNVYIAEAGANLVRKVDAAGIISTVAGNGTKGSKGDGGPATSAQLFSPQYLAFDSGGNLLIGTGNDVRRVDSNGTITTAVGVGTKGFDGDGGQATQAELNWPQRAVMDASGNLFVADTFNARIRKISPNGVIVTIAGNGAQVESGDGGPAIQASLFDITGIAVDAIGNVYLSEGFGNRIRRIDTGGTITTFAGTGTAGSTGDGGQATAAKLSNPKGVAVDPAGNVYIADFGNSRVRKVNTSGIISSLSGTFASKFVSVDNAGNVYIADSSNRLFRVSPSGVSTNIAGKALAPESGDGGPASLANLTDPQAVTVDSYGNVFIAEGDLLLFLQPGNGNRIRKVTPGGLISTVAGTSEVGFAGDGSPAISAQFNGSYGVTVDTAGNVYVTEQYNSSVRKADLGFVPTSKSAPVFRGDFDGDGKVDILWQHNDGRVAIWLMNGVGLSSGAVVNGANTGWLVKQVADFNGDGRADILWQHSGGQITIWLMNGLTNTASSVITAGIGWNVQNVADFNGDGRADILWQNTDGRIAIWLFDGINLIGADIIMGPGTGWGVKALGDFNGDGKSDIIWQHVDGSTTIWLMNGLNFTNAAGLIGPGTGWSVRAIGDFNGDGKSDIVWQHLDGTTTAWLMDGLFMTSGGGFIGPGTGWSVQQIGDLDGDGKSDILWQNVDGSSAVWLMNGLSLTGGAGFLGPGSGWFVRQTADVNGDGKSDIIWQSIDGGTAVWLMDGMNLTSGGGLLAAGSGWSPAR